MNDRIERAVFFELLKAGLFPVHCEGFMVNDCSTVDWADVYKLAAEQSVVGLVAAGIDTVQGSSTSEATKSSACLKVHSSPLVPQEWALQFIGQTLQIEQRNKAMNAFVAELIDGLRKKDVYTLLVKGQGIAQCYEMPLWRACGDVDLFLSKDNYKKALQILSPLATSIEEENVYCHHIEMTIDGWSVEMHGTLRSGLWKRIDKEIDSVQNEVSMWGRVRSWMNGQTQVFLPAADEDAIFVFSHILQHFYKEGIGLRQICDWCRLLWTYRDSLNKGLLEQRIKRMGVMTEWKAFAALAVDYLGMPAEAMPFYSDSSRWKRKASRILDFVIETGNFGHNRDYTYRKKYPYMIMKAISLCRHAIDFMKYFTIFPLDSMKVSGNRIKVGLSYVVKGK